MSFAEADEVKRLALDSREAVGCYYAAFFVCTVAVSALFALAGLVAAQAAGGEERRFVGTGVLCGLVLMMFVWLRERPRGDRVKLADARSNEVELLHVHAFAAARAPAEDAFFFDVGEGSILLVHGPATRAPMSQGRFPNRYFTLVVLPRAGSILSVECHGEPLPATEAAPELRLDSRHLPDVVTFPARFETAAQDLAVLLGSGWVP